MLMPAPARRKLDPRFAFLLSLDDEGLKRRHAFEAQKLSALAKEIRSTRRQLGEGASVQSVARILENLRSLNQRLFAPLTTGVSFAEDEKEAGAMGVELGEPYFSVLILCDMSLGDLRAMHVPVRNQFGDIFTAHVTRDQIAELEGSDAVRFMELARPLFPNLFDALEYTQINKIHAGLPAPDSLPPNNGEGVIIGVIDNALDLAHPDFQVEGSAAIETRVLFLWDQNLIALAGESAPPAMTGFVPPAILPGVEYPKAKIDPWLQAVGGAVPVRHAPSDDPHGTVVTGCAAGNGQAFKVYRGANAADAFVIATPALKGAAPKSDIIFVAQKGVAGTDILADSPWVLDAFKYIFAKAAMLGKACVVNLSESDNQGAHDGTALGEQALDILLGEPHPSDPQRAITLSSGNSNGNGEHASTIVVQGAAAPTKLILNYVTLARTDPVSGVTSLVPPTQSDAVELWYSGSDRIAVLLTTPPSAGSVQIGLLQAGAIVPLPAGGGTVVAVDVGTGLEVSIAPGVKVLLTSIVDDPRNHDNHIQLIIALDSSVASASIPIGDWTFELTGTTVLSSGTIHAWVDRNNRGFAKWTVGLSEDQYTVAVPSSARDPITVGAHDKQDPPQVSNNFESSGRALTRDGRTKPDIATVGAAVWAPLPLSLQGTLPFPYFPQGGTSVAAPIVAGACALMFNSSCRGPKTTPAHLKYILQFHALTGFDPLAFGAGPLKMITAAGTVCGTAEPDVDVWMREDEMDDGTEPFTREVFWASPDILVLNLAETESNPIHDATLKFTTLVDVIANNRGADDALNVEVLLYWADPATNLTFPLHWQRAGIFTLPGSIDGAGIVFTNPMAVPVAVGNSIVIDKIPAGGKKRVRFVWAPPPSGSNLRSDNHFCLLARLEHAADPSHIDLGGWSIVPDRNNIALHNVHIVNVLHSMASMHFSAIGSGKRDGLAVRPDIRTGRVTLELPALALPLRDRGRIEAFGGRFPPFTGTQGPNPLADLTMQPIGGAQIEALTGIRGASRLEVHRGTASIVIEAGKNLFIPELRATLNTRVPMRLLVEGVAIDQKKRWIHVIQVANGARLGGVAMKLSTSALR
jgi:hypothetical protein